MNNQQSMYIFLGEATPKLWFEQAPQHLDELLIDHAHCERKAAYFALKLIKSYADKSDLVYYASRLAREELVHFERVLKLMAQKGIKFKSLSSSRYAGTLQRMLSTDSTVRFLETLLIAAFIEARSCERFIGLIPYLEPDLAAFYERLAASEARHYEHYLSFAKQYAGEIELEPLIKKIQIVENEIIQHKSVLFRFHSGPIQ